MLRSWTKVLVTLLPALPLGAAVVGGCASAGGGGAPLADPAGTVGRLRAETGAQAAARIRFRWEYGDPKGRLRGDGVARVNPPDSFRLDLFTSGEGSMAVALTDDSLSTLGEIEDLELPTAPFLYAMAGLFRPGPSGPAEGFRTGTGVVLAFETPNGRRRTFTFEGDRLVRLEERAGGRTTQRIALSWEGDGDWPRSADYRDLETPRRVEWRLEEAVGEPSRFPAEIFELGTDG